MGDKHVEFLKRTLVEQQGDTLTGGELALLVLFVDTFLATTQAGLATLVQQLFYLLFKSHNILWFNVYGLRFVYLQQNSVRTPKVDLGCRKPM